MDRNSFVSASESFALQIATATRKKVHEMRTSEYADYRLVTDSLPGTGCSACSEAGRQSHARRGQRDELGDTGPDAIDRSCAAGSQCG